MGKLYVRRGINRLCDGERPLYGIFKSSSSLHILFLLGQDQSAINVSLSVILFASQTSVNRVSHPGSQSH